MKVIILGVGRSGTTALYALLQEIMSEQITGEIEYIYEPFLWDHTKFNDRYEKVNSNFQYIDFISPEAILNHKQLPLYIEEPASFKTNVFLNNVLQPKSTKSYLVKFIRANGRFLLLNEICPACKPVFIIRNPIDVINSVITKFSFFGGEFHEDDFPKFIRETNSVFTTSLKKEMFKSQVEKELAFWYYMNLFAFKSFKKSKNKPFIICYDEYVKDRAPIVEDLCLYLGLKYKPTYSNVAEKKVFPITDIFQLPKEDESLFNDYLDKYFKILRDNKINFSFDKDTILSKYKFTDQITYKLNKNYGLVPLVLNKKNERLETKLMETITDKEQLVHQVQTLEAEIVSKATEIDLKTEEIYKKGGEINWYQNKMKENALDKEKSDSILIEKDKLINQQNELLTSLIADNQKSKEIINQHMDEIRKEKEGNALLTARLKQSEISTNDLLKTITDKDAIIAETNHELEIQLKKFTQQLTALKEDLTEKEKSILLIQEELNKSTEKVKLQETLHDTSMKEFKQKYELMILDSSKELQFKVSLIDDLKKQSAIKDTTICNAKDELNRSNINLAEKTELIRHLIIELTKLKEDQSKLSIQLSQETKLLKQVTTDLQETKSDQHKTAALLVAKTIATEQIHAAFMNRNYKIKELTSAMELQTEKNETIIKGELQVREMLNKLIDQKDHELAIKEKLIVDRANILRDKLKELDTIYKSKSWKIGRMLVKIVSLGTGGKK